MLAMNTLAQKLTTLNWRGLLLPGLTGCWLAGIILAGKFNLPAASFLLCGIVPLIGCSLFWRKRRIRFLALALLFLCLGAWRYATVSLTRDPLAINAFIGPHIVELRGEINAEPDLEQKSTLLIVSAQSISLDHGQTWQDAHGELQVQASGATFDDPYGPHYGEEVELTGKLLAPPDYATPELLASMAFPILEIGEQEGNPLLMLLAQWRIQLAGIMLQTLPQPYAALLIGLFLSLHTPALKPLLPFFNVTGTAHLIAPSGFKVTILAGLINYGTRWLLPAQKGERKGQPAARRRQGQRRRWLHSGLIILCIALYTFLSGGGPAAIRAGVMGSLLVVAPRLERIYNVYTALALTALLMSLLDPFVLWDTGFQLSFVGTSGIVLLTPFFERLLHSLTHLPAGEQITEILAVTLAAQIATLPIFAVSFNQVSLPL